MGGKSRRNPMLFQRQCRLAEARRFKGAEEEVGFVVGTGLDVDGFVAVGVLGLPVFLCGRSQQNCSRPESIQRRHGRLVSHRNF